jgi:hypothetical protein
MNEETASNFTDVRVEAGEYPIIRTLTRDGVRYSVDFPGRVSASYYRSRLGGHTSNEVDRGLGMLRIYRKSMAAADLAYRVSEGLNAFGGAVQFNDLAAFALVEQEPSEHAKAARAYSLQMCLRDLDAAIERDDAPAVEMWQNLVTQLSRPAKPSVAFAIDA